MHALEIGRIIDDIVARQITAAELEALARSVAVVADTLQIVEMLAHVHEIHAYELHVESVASLTVDTYMIREIIARAILEVETCHRALKLYRAAGHIDRREGVVDLVAFGVGLRHLEGVILVGER